LLGVDDACVAATGLTGSYSSCGAGGGSGVACGSGGAVGAAVGCGDGVATAVGCGDGVAVTVGVSTGAAAFCSSGGFGSWRSNATMPLKARTGSIPCSTQ
jgi:hypothetical protein